MQSYINNKLNSKAKGIYAVLNVAIQFELDDKIKDKEEANQKQNNQKQEHPAYTILKKFNFLMKSVYSKANEDNTTIKIVEKQIEWLRYLPEHVQYKNKNGKNVYWKYFKIELEEEECNRIVEQLVIHNLRRSLRKNKHIVLGNGKVQEINTLEVVKKLMIAFCNVSDKKKFQEKFNNISKIELEEFLKILNEDYTKQKQITHIVKSIEKQNVKVQCVHKDNKVLLQLASAGNKGKEGYEGKEHIFEFLKEYAAATVQQRNEKLIHFRKLIILYYRGIEKYREADGSDISAWDFGSFKAKEKECFCVEAKTLIENKKEMSDKTERRKQNEQIQQVIKKEIVQRYRTIKENVKLTGADIFWLEFIEEQARKILIGRKNVVSLYKLSTKYLCDSTWKEWISYIGMKYIDMGKAVYHFAMPDVESLSKYTTLQLYP